MGHRRGGYLISLIVAAALACGCSAGLVRQEGLDATAKVFVVSVVMPRVADDSREADRRVLQAAVDHAAMRVRAGLADLRPWKVQDAVHGGGKALQSLGKVHQKDLDELFPQDEERGRVREAVGEELVSWRERFIGAAGLPVIPREALASDDEPVPQDPAVRAVMLRQAGELCHTLNVDAVVFAHVRSVISHPRENAFIVTDGRTDGLLAMSATLVIIDKTGRIIVDMGIRPVDGRSPSRDLLPLYRGTGREAVTTANIDLNDPKKKVPQAFTALVDEAVAELMAGLKAELKQ